MGQYWMPVWENQEGKRYSINAHQFGNGLKFLEHSYIGNSVTSVVMENLYKTPSRLSWVGDYCEDRRVGQDKTGPTGNELYDSNEAVWFICEAKRPEYIPLLEKPHWKSLTLEEVGGYCSKFGEEHIGDYILVNYDKKMYLDFKEYVDYGKNYGDNWLIHPLAALTAGPSMCEGGGDYDSGDINFDRVGLWSWDLISVEDRNTEFKDYQTVPIDLYYFSEKY